MPSQQRIVVGSWPKHHRIVMIDWHKSIKDAERNLGVVSYLIVSLMTWS